MALEVTTNLDGTLQRLSSATRRQMFQLGMKLMETSQDAKLADNAGDHYGMVSEGTAVVQALLAQLQMLTDITTPMGARGQRRAVAAAGAPQNSLPPEMLVEVPDEPGMPPDALYAGRDDVPTTVLASNHREEAGR